MTTDEFAWSMRAYTGRSPFEPFMIEFVNGEQIEIQHPEAVGFWRGLAMFRSHTGGFCVFGVDAVCRVFDSEEDEGLL